MQEGSLTSPAKSDWISIIWTGLSLLQEQGGYYSLAGRINRTIAQSGGRGHKFESCRARQWRSMTYEIAAFGRMLRVAPGVAHSASQPLTRMGKQSSRSVGSCRCSSLNILWCKIAGTASKPKYSRAPGGAREAGETTSAGFT